MKYRVQIQPRAVADVTQIFDWIGTQSPSGARRWFDEFMRVLESVAANPLGFGFAPENKQATAEIHQAIFRTRRGKPYRVVFYVEEDNVHIVHVRGHGQDLIPPENFD